jgi:hypothetical protein
MVIIAVVATILFAWRAMDIVVQLYFTHGLVIIAVVATILFAWRAMDTVVQL